MKSLALIPIAISLLMACEPVEKPNEPEKPPVKKTKKIGPVVTIHCTLKNVKTNMVTKGTYFTYDTRTQDMPTKEMFDGVGLFKQFERDAFKDINSRFRLTDGVVVLPIKQHRNKFRLDIKNIWYKHGRSWHFLKRHEKSKYQYTYMGIGNIGFGERIKGTNVFEGMFEFTSGSEFGGTMGTWVLYHDIETPDDDEWGYLRCGTESLDGDSISIPAGIK